MANQQVKQHAQHGLNRFRRVLSFCIESFIAYHLSVSDLFFKSGQITKNLSCFFYLLLLFFCSNSFAIDFDAFFEALKKGDKTAIEQLIQEDENFNVEMKLCNPLQSSIYDNPLMVAARHGYTDIAEDFITRGADIDAQNNCGGTALMYAAAQGHIQTVVLLVNYKANLNLRDHFDNTALIYAALQRHTEVVKYLLNRGLDINIKNSYGDTPLMEAASEGPLETVIFLINNGADVNIQNNNGNTALMNAVFYKQIEIVKYLVEERGADVNIQNNQGNTALMIAAECYDPETMIYLIEKKADPTIKNASGKTPLIEYIACGGKDFIYILELLITKDIGFNIKNSLHANRLQFAFQRLNKRLQNPNHTPGSYAYAWNALMTLLQLFKSDDLNNCRIEKDDSGKMNLIFRPTKNYPMNKYTLINNLPAPETLISDYPLQDAAEYVILKTHRFDEIDGLPLPAKHINNIKNKLYLPVKFYSLFEPYLKVHPLNCK
ncbi:MAG: ankyrin repeat domain-containing protein [Endozoicomonadaceae bacterium]|nr:ankyrin repeat domain-containing protein [Endozoicomonadaceae bacterium]